MSKKKHITILSILLLVTGIISFFVAIGFLVGFPIIGKLIGEFVENPIANTVLTYVGAGVGSLLLVISIPVIVAGIGLIYHRSWARILALIVCFIKLFSIPFGTILGIYGIWVLMHDESIEILKN